MCHDCFPSNKVVRKNDDDEADALYSVKETDLVQVSYSTFLSPGTSSTSAPGQIDEKLVPSNGTGQTQDQDCSFLSLISPIQESREINGTNDSNWLQIWNTEELQEMQEDDPSVQFILNMKCENDVRPVLPDEVKANQIIKALWHQWNSLEVKSGILYRRWQDAQGYTVYQLITPKKIWLDEQESQETAELNENSVNADTNESFEIDSDHNTSATLPNAESLLNESIIRVPVKEPVKRTQVPVIRTRRECPIKPKQIWSPD